MEFKNFKLSVQQQFEKMKSHQLYVVDLEKGALWETYLSSFPAGTNQIYRERAEYDCQCCRQFIRAVGGVVAIIDGKVVSIWDVTTPDAAYNVVADALSDLVKSKPINNIFLHTEPTAGTDKNFQDTDNGVLTWEHFFVKLPPAVVCRKDAIGPKLGDAKGDYDVFFRSLTETSRDAIDTVLELIGQNSLYRGEENRAVVESFLKLHTEFQQVSDKKLFCWSKMGKAHQATLRIRNTSIGALLTDLSEGVPLDRAVASFESSGLRPMTSNYQLRSTIHEAINARDE